MTEESFLAQITSSVQARFDKARSLLSFEEYLEETRRAPELFCRNSVQYIYDAFLHFGTVEVKTPIRTLTRFRLFDQESAQGKRWVVGQEEAQQSLFRMLGNFVREGRVTRLLLLHGPNGSGKSSLVQVMLQALERYSHTEEGALYRYNWVFPAEKLKRGGIGFSSDGRREHPNLHSFAHLDGDQIEARIPSFLKDHPLLLLPQPEREMFFSELRESGRLPESFQLSEYLLSGDLDPRSRMIFDALMAHYGGDYAEVLRHVQVERFYISQRYRSGGVTIEPQMHVDASVRQVSADRSLATLPKPLNNLNLFEAFGPLVDANRGMIEYSDLLKRPLEAFKYLLGTCETGRVEVEPVILYLDLLLVGNANDLNLDHFKEMPEFASFKSRVELIRVPYIMQASLEREIYDALLKQSGLQKPIAPHTTQLAALWAVLTRLKRPNPTRLPDAIASIAERLTPLQKARLYDGAGLPEHLTSEEAKQLKQHLRDLFEESKNDIHYEGRIGASPRELRSVLLNAAQNAAYPTLSPLALFEELEALVQQRSVYEFLQIEPRDGYYDPASFIEVIRQEHLRLIDREFQIASGLIQPDQYSQRLARYIQHVKAYIRKEKVTNPITHASEDPDETLMTSVEEVILPEGEEVESFRESVISKIAVHSLENPGEEVDIKMLFRDEIQAMEAHFFSSQRKRLGRIAKHCLVLLTDDSPNLGDAERKEAEATVACLEQDFGYPRAAIRETVALLLSKKYE